MINCGCIPSGLCDTHDHMLDCQARVFVNGDPARERARWERWKQGVNCPKRSPEYMAELAERIRRLKCVAGT